MAELSSRLDMAAVFKTELASGEKRLIDKVVGMSQGTSSSAMGAEQAVNSLMDSVLAVSEKGHKSPLTELAAATAIVQAVKKYDTPEIRERVTTAIATQVTATLRALDAATGTNDEYELHARSALKPLIAITAGQDSEFLTALRKGIQDAHTMSPALKDGRNTFLASTLMQEAIKGKVAA